MAETEPETVTNGESEKSEFSEDYTKLVEYGLNESVAEELDKIFTAGKMAYADLDERALDALKEFPADGAHAVLKQFSESNLEHVTNKSAFLCGVMKTYRQRNKRFDGGVTDIKGPDEAKLKEILDRTGYTLDVTTGQRKYGGPPPDWGDQQQPGPGCEVFCGKIPKDTFEDELIPLFEKSGKIWDLRLMMDPLTGQNRGYAFVTFCDKEGAQQAVKQVDNYEIKKGKTLKVNVSVPNMRLFVGNIPKSKSRDEIKEEFGKLTSGLNEVIVYSAPDDKKKNRGFCFLEYETHKAASLAKRRLGNGRTRVWNCDIIVDWADPQEEPDDDTMSKVKVLYVRNLTAEASEEKLKELFEPHGKIDRIKKIKDYAFVHYEDRDDAVKAKEALHGKECLGSIMEISLAKPQSENKKKEKRLREQERRMMLMMGSSSGRGFFDDAYGSRMPPMPPRGRGGMRGPPPPPRSFDYDYDYYGYGGDYRGGYMDPYYDDYYGGSGGGGGRFDDYEFGYGPGYGPMPRGRGRGIPPMRGGRGIPAPRGRGGMPVTRGGPMRGAPARGRGPRGAPRGTGNNARGRGSKRKLDGQQAQGGDNKRRPQNHNQWGAQPIAQQPLDSSQGVNFGGGGYNADFYEDSYGGGW